mmetsp:Transcript_11898/g.42064  ORF Transcript_11898/g.42064 Transcript_11898/m.42064 type:complete len:229 (-) Transcript_11898:252-938(-)
MAPGNVATTGSTISENRSAMRPARLKTCNNRGWNASFPFPGRLICTPPMTASSVTPSNMDGVAWICRRSVLRTMRYMLSVSATMALLSLYFSMSLMRGASDFRMKSNWRSSLGISSPLPAISSARRVLYAPTDAPQADEDSAWPSRSILPNAPRELMPTCGAKTMRSLPLSVAWCAYALRPALPEKGRPPRPPSAKDFPGQATLRLSMRGAFTSSGQSDVPTSVVNLA